MAITLVPKVCGRCKKAFTVRASDARRGKGKYCGRTCSAEATIHKAIAERNFCRICCRPRDGERVTASGLCRSCSGQQQGRHYGKQQNISWKTRKEYNLEGNTSSWWIRPMSHDEFSTAQRAEFARMKMQCKDATLKRTELE